MGLSPLQNFQHSFRPGRHSDKFVGEIRIYTVICTLKPDHSVKLFFSELKFNSSFQSYPSVVLFRFKTPNSSS